MNAHEAIAILVNGRYFRGFGRNGRLLTAWSLAGARLFAAWRPEEIEEVERRLRAKGYEPVRYRVSSVPQATTPSPASERDRSA